MMRLKAERSSFWLIDSLDIYIYRSSLDNNFQNSRPPSRFHCLPGFGVSAFIPQTRPTLITHSSRSFIRLDEHGFPVHGRQFQDSNFAVVRGQCVGNTFGDPPRRIDNNIERGGTRKEFARLGCSSSAISDDPLLPCHATHYSYIYLCVYIYIDWVAVDLIGTLITVLGSTNSFNRD